MKELNWRLVFVLCLCDGAHFYSICSLFSYAGVMSADLEWVSDRDSAGFVAGLLASGGMFGRTLTSQLVGRGARRFGYKAMIVVAMLSVAIGGVVFGLSTSLPMALIARVVFLGCFNGWVTLMSPLSMEIGGEERQVEVLGAVMGAGSFTQLFGPAVGGWTYGWWAAFPAAVPSMLGSAYALVTCCMIYVWMPSGLGKRVVEFDADGTISKPKEERGNACSLVLTRPLLLITLMRFLHGCTAAGIMELVPLWAISSEPLGGLAMSQVEVGSLLARSAIWNVIYFSIVMPRCSKSLGIRRFAMVASGVAAMCCIAIPSSPSVAVANILQALSMTFSVSMGAMGAAFTNNVSPPDMRAEVAGVIMILETMGKVFGPICVATGFAASLSRWGHAGHSIAFIGLASLNLCYLALACCLPNSVEGAHNQLPQKDSAPAETIGMSCSMSVPDNADDVSQLLEENSPQTVADAVMGAAEDESRNTSGSTNASPRDISLKP